HVERLVDSRRAAGRPAHCRSRDRRGSRNANQPRESWRRPAGTDRGTRAPRPRRPQLRHAWHGRSPPAPLAMGSLDPRGVPAAVVMARLLYGVDFFAARPVATVARIAPRPLLLIHGTADDYVPIANFHQLQAAATSSAGSQVTTWIVPNARHAQAFKKTGAEYITRVVAFFDAALGPAA